MAINWREIVTPQEGVKALFWDVLVLGIIGSAMHRLYKAISPERKRTAIIKICLFLGWLTLMSVSAYCVSQIIIITTNHLAARTVALTKRSPDLVMEPAVSMMAAGQAENKKDTFLIVLLAIYNQGSPTIIKHWAFHITPLEGSPIDAPVVGNFEGPMQFAVPFTSPILGPNTNKLEKKDWLYERLHDNPINEGSMVQGFIMFIAPQTSVDYLRIPGTKAELSFSDVNDRIYRQDVPLPSMTRQVAQ